jgi:5'-nucleotidase
LKVVLTNDDGIDAAGLQMLYRCVRNSGQIVVVAPDRPQSGIGHRVTTRSAIRVEQLDADKFSVNGTPADCARLALKKLAPDAAWLIAGINPGANLGSDVYNSGTVAAAREAAILGVRSIAISQYIAKDHEVNWELTGHYAEPILGMLMAKQLSKSHFWNVNLPHPLAEGAAVAFEFCGLDTNPHKYDFLINENEYSYKGSIHERPRKPGTDVAVCFDEKKIAITRIAVGTTKFDHHG